MVDVNCTPPCTTSEVEPIPGVRAVFFADGSEGDDGTDASLVSADVATSAVIGTWVELMPADALRVGASVQAVFAAGNVFIKQSDTLPLSGKKVGELQIPAAPAYFNFNFAPKKRYFMRGDMASLIVALKTW